MKSKKSFSTDKNQGKSIIFARAYNMNTEIKHINYRIYPNTFIQNVVVVMGFDNDSVNPKFDVIPTDRLKTFLKDNFGFQLQDGEPKKQASLSSEELGLNFQFFTNKVSLRVNCINYQSFEATVMPLIYKLRSYLLEVLGKDSVDYIKIRKVDMFPFQLMGNPDNTIFGKMMHHLLSKDLLDGPVEGVEKTEEAVTDIERRTLSDAEFDYVVKTGVVKSASEQGVYLVILDTSSTTKTDRYPNINKNNIEEILQNQNQRMFDLYHWAVTDEVKKVMLLTPTDNDES